MLFLTYTELIACCLVACVLPYLIKKYKKTVIILPEAEECPTLLRQKQVLAILLIQDIKISKGKTCAELGHSVAEALLCDQQLVSSWVCEGKQLNIYKVKSNEECEKYLEIAQSYPIENGCIHDAGHTQIAPNTVTVGWILGDETLIKELLKDCEMM